MSLRTGRIPIIDVQPVVDCGRLPAKAVAGEAVEVSATVFREGHGLIAARVVLRGPRGATAPEPTPLVQREPGTDRFVGSVVVPSEGDWFFVVEAWADPLATWLRETTVKVEADQDVTVALQDGVALLQAGAAATGPWAATLTRAAQRLADPPADRQALLAALRDPDLADAAAASPVREHHTRSQRWPLRVSRPRALFGSWYELFPRSEGAVVDEDGRAVRSGTFATASLRLPAVAAMGFDVVYLPPVHPIGTTHRKGPNNSLVAGPGDPGVPWAIGGPAGGHDAIDPALGTFEDFDDFVAVAAAAGIEVALDLALQASPDHPWLQEHPQWFTRRSDGSVAFAENPPKRYEDIVPLNFDNDYAGLYAEILRVVRLWMAHGVRIFRVDNPHTKPLHFWEELIGEVHAQDPGVIFLAEAFTRPAMMRQLAKVGFDQSYTYFTWRTAKHELEAYASELAGETAAYLRPNLFVNTPDILHAYLQYGGPAAFKIRATLAATLAPTWGMYAGYELGEHVAVRAGSEEYLDSEKYQLRPRDWAGADTGPGSIIAHVTALNALRRQHPALQWLRNLVVHHADHDAVTVYSKRRFSQGRWDTVLCVVCLDPASTVETTVRLDMPALGAAWEDELIVTDAFTGQTWRWGQAAYVRLDPHEQPAHLLAVSVVGDPD